MSQEMIQPLNGISSELEAIKNMVGSKDGGYPFVLFPVRVETRFMEEDQIFTLLEEDLFYDFQDTVFELEYLSNYTLLPQIEVPEFIELAGTIVSNLETANTQILKTLPVDAVDKRKLETVHDNFRSNISKVETKLKKISGGSSSQAVQANQLLTQIRTQKKTLKKEFTNQEVSGQTPWSDASRLLDQVNTVKRTVKKINNKDLTLSRKESKTRVYPYLDKKFDDLNIAYQAIKQVSRDNLKSTKTQFNRIQALRAEIQSDVQSVPEQLVGIASDFKRDEYQLRFQQLKTQQLDSMLQELDEEILPKMNYLSALQRVPVKDMLFDARKMLRDFKFKNAQQISNYQWIKSTREDMYEQLRPFRADSRKIIEGSPEDIQKLKSTWSEIDQEIARFTAKIQLEFKPKTRTERSGLSRTITHLTDEYRKDLEGLKPNSDQSETIVEKQVIPLGNKDFTNSAKAYHQAQKGLSSINQKLKGLTAESKPKASAINALHQELIGFTDSYAQLEKATTVLPNAFYQEIQSNVQTLQSEMNTLNGIIDTQQITGLNFSTSSRGKPAQSVNMMKSTASSYYADVVDETDHFYDETRNSIIFATHTFGTRDVLWVRMYPDDIMVDSHEDALTQDEVQAGRDYWNEMFVASGHKVMENAAWNALCADFGARRAVWVAKETKPDPDSFSAPFINLIKLIEGLEEANLHMESAAKGIHILTHLSSQTREGVFYASRKLLEIQPLYESYFNQRYVPEFLFIQYQNAVLKLKSLVQTGLDTFSGPQFQGAEGDFQVVIHHCTRLLELLAALEPSKTSFIIQSLGANRNFPNHVTKDASWSKASETYVLPDRFVVIAIKDGEIRHAQTGKAIPENLKVGIDPTDESGFQHDLFGNLNVPEDLKWMVNYQEAKKVGMGITLPLKSDEAIDGFDKLFVLGLRSDNALNGRNTLEKLFKNHRYDDEGMSFLNVGTATNNTGDSVQAYNSDDLDPDYAYQMEMMGPVYQPSTDPKEYTDGQRLAKALGIRDSTFQHIEGSGNQEISEALRMNQVLFPATLGLFMEDFLDKVFSYDVTERTREFAEKFVSARGMLPSLRIGTQPYGFLITSAFSKFKVKSIGKNRAKWYEVKRNNFLNDMKNYWQELAGDVAHVTKEVEDRQKNFLDVLGLHASSEQFFYRRSMNVASRQRMSDLGRSINFTNQDEFGPLQLVLKFPSAYNGIFEGLGLMNKVFESRLYHSRYLNTTGDLTGNIIDHHKLSETESLHPRSVSGSEKDYIEYLLSERPFTLLNNSQPYNSLLFIMMRYAYLLEHRKIALDILQNEGLLNIESRNKLGDANNFWRSYQSYMTKRPLTKWNMLFEDLASLKNYSHLHMQVDNPFFRYMVNRPFDNPMDMYLLDRNNIRNMYPGKSDHQAEIDELFDYRSSLSSLRDIPTARLDRLFREHIDLCSYRLDPWILGQAAERLDRDRSNFIRKNGTFLGAFGWLENLRPGQPRTLATNLPSEFSNMGRVYRDGDNLGFIHAPSLDHAVAAAIMRSGYLANNQDDDAKNTMAINLSSARVRTALHMMDGVRNGQDPGALLGYMFERGLHEGHAGLELDEFIFPLRRTFPLSAEVDETLTNPDAHGLAEFNVVNGTAILDAVLAVAEDQFTDQNDTLYKVMLANPGLYPFGLKDKDNNSLLPNRTTQKQEYWAILREIDRMADAFDALSDLTIAESVYQLSKGNYARAGAVADAIANGTAPPEPQIVNTPRSGKVITHRVVWNLIPVDTRTLGNEPAKTAAMPALWQSNSVSPAALAAPAINKLCGQILGNPADIRFLVGEEGATLQAQSLVDLDIQAIDFLRLMDGETGGGDLERLIAYQFRQAQNLTDESQISISFKDRDASWSDSVRTLFDLAPMIRSLQEIISESKATYADDLLIPGESASNPGGLIPEEFEARVNLAYNTLDFIQINLSNQTYSNNGDLKVSMSNAELDIIRTSLLDASQFGIANAVPIHGSGNTDKIVATLAAQSDATIKAIGKRLAEATKKISNIAPSATEKEKINAYDAALNILFDKGFKALPLFTPKNSAELQTTGQHSDHLLRHDPDFPMETWSHSISKVREKMRHLDMLGMYAEAFDATMDEKSVVQIPYEPDDYWLGIPFPNGYDPENEKLSLVVLNLDQWNSNGIQTGLVIDEWVETIPNKEEMTGVAMHYDQPDAKPPQSVLVAVNPDEGENWTWDNLVYTLMDTLELAKIRAVEPKHIRESALGHVLPAIVSENNLPENVGLDLHVENLLYLNNTQIEE